MVRVLTSVDSAPQHWEYTERYVSHFRFHVFKDAGGGGEIHRSTDLGKPRPPWDGLSCSSLTQNAGFPFLQEQQAVVNERGYLSPPLSERKHSGPRSSRPPYSGFSTVKRETANSSLSPPPGFSIELHITETASRKQDKRWEQAFSFWSWIKHLLAEWPWTH